MAAQPTQCSLTDALVPIEQRVASLGAQISTLQARSAVLSKPRVRVLPVRNGKPVVRLLRSA